MSKLPVIVVDRAYDRLPAFINDMPQDVVVFIDEYEKIFKEDNHSMLPLMDGVMTNKFRRFFLLTSNSVEVNYFLLQRPGRIRYLREYEDLSEEAIIEIVDAKLIHKHHRSVLIEFISRLQIITVDIVQAVIEEVNLFDQDPVEFEDVFNVSRKDKEYDLFERKTVDEKEEVTLIEKHRTRGTFEQDDINSPFRANYSLIGLIAEVINEQSVVVKDMSTNEKRTFFTLEKESLHESFHGKKKK
jgi:hypothetical protein